MRHLGGILLCTALFSVVVGCSDYSAMRDEVKSNNNRVAMVRDNYTASKDAGGPLDKGVRASLQTGSVVDLSTVGIPDKDITGVIKPAVTAMEEALSGYIDNANNRAIASGSDSTVKSRDDLLVNSFSVHYFIDDKSGKVEQLFFVQLPDGFTGRLSVYWQGGRYIESKTFGAI